jgi:hypothetical protein
MNKILQNSLNELSELQDRIQKAYKLRESGAKINEERWMLDASKLTEVVEKINLQIKLCRDGKM